MYVYHYIEVPVYMLYTGININIYVCYIYIYTLNVHGQLNYACVVKVGNRKKIHVRSGLSSGMTVERGLSTVPLSSVLFLKKDEIGKILVFVNLGVWVHESTMGKSVYV